MRINKKIGSIVVESLICKEAVTFAVAKTKADDEIGFAYFCFVWLKNVKNKWPILIINNKSLM